MNCFLKLISHFDQLLEVVHELPIFPIFLYLNLLVKSLRVGLTSFFVTAVLAIGDIVVEVLGNIMGGSLVVILECIDVLSFYVVQILQNVLEGGSFFRRVLSAIVDQSSKVFCLRAELLEVILRVHSALLGQFQLFAVIAH